MFRKILIANRGEIACRVIKTARRLGVKTVAVYSTADRDALHVRMADEAYLIGPAPSAKSYLVAANIIAAIKESGAEAVHPGYGFLSENAAFARRLEKEGVVFIGPSAAAIAAMGDKIKSKVLAAAAGVNTIPGHGGALEDSRQAVAAARKVGYPVMLKASAGGGGKGMAVAHGDRELREAFAATRREAESSFGDKSVFVEKFIQQPRHIEIQVLADGHGNVVHLGERECSIQRRHQKVIEESPSPFIDEETRRAMGEQAVMLARAVKYVSAGTVEFIVDQQRNFHFLEMNTRLQVEHPVTELVTGLDLVELMLLIAAGEKLPFAQDDVKMAGWAIEARLYAEDPGRGFLPSCGRLVRYREPRESRFVRVDTGVCEGGEIPFHYDPMIAKLIAWGEGREAAVAHLRKALDSFHIRGVAHNIGFLAALAAHPRFAEGRLSTGFIAEEFPNGFNPELVILDHPAHLLAAAAAIHHAYQTRVAAISGQVPGHQRRVRDDWVVVVDNQYHPLTMRPVEGGFDMVLGGESLELRTDWKLGDPLFRATVNGRDMCVQFRRLAVGYRLVHSGRRSDILVLNPRAAELNALMPVKALPDTSRFLLSPLPGLLVSLAAAKGQEVKAGEILAVIEAMKMENVLRAERDCVVADVPVRAGDSLAVDQVIVEFE